MPIAPRQSPLLQRKERKRLVYAIFFAVYTVWTTFLDGIPGLFAFVFILMAYGGTWFLLSSLMKRRFLDRWEAYDSFAGFAYFLFGLPFLAISLFVLYQLRIEPAMLPHYVLTNGEKTVHFQGMAHIASKRFYDSVEKDLRNVRASSGSGVLFYEWIRAFSGKSVEEFSKMLGTKFDADTYGEISGFMWLRAQDNRQFLGIMSRDSNVDVSLEDIVKKTKERLGSGSLASSGASLSWSGQVEIVDPAVMLAEAFSWTTSRQGQVFRAIGLAFFSMSVKNDSFSKALEKSPERKAVFDTILGDRNTVIAQAVRESKDQTIYLMYGMLHAEWVIHDLMLSDPKWKVEKIEWKTFLE